MKKHAFELAEIELEKRKPLLQTVTKYFYDVNKLEELERNSILLLNKIEADKAEEDFFNNFAKEFIFNSNNIEGSKIPREKVLEILETGDSKYADRNEVKEVKNSIAAFGYLRKNFSFNQQSIKQLYNILTKDLKREDGSAYLRGFKKIEIVVGNSRTAKPKEVKKEISALLDWLKKNKKNLHPLELAFDFHLYYESIHPFIDANGRTGRMLMNKILIQNNYSPIIIYKENKEAYFNAIAKAREGKKQKYFQFMIEQANKTYKQMLEQN